jgi:hypothetical protein
MRCTRAREPADPADRQSAGCPRILAGNPFKSLVGNRDARSVPKLINGNTAGRFYSDKRGSDRYRPCAMHHARRAVNPRTRRARSYFLLLDTSSLRHVPLRDGTLASN